MKMMIILLLVFLSVSTFGEVTKDPTQSEQEVFLKLFDASVVARQKGIDFYFSKKDRLSSKGVLTSQDLQSIYSFADGYSKNRDVMFEQIKKMRSKISYFDRIRFRTKKSTQISHDPDGHKTIYINLADDEGAELLQDILMATIYGQILFDDFLVLVEPYYSQPKIRYLLNRDFTGRIKFLDTLASDFYNPFLRESLLKGLSIANRAEERIVKSKIPISSFLSHLFKLIHSSPAGNYLKKEGLIESGTLTNILLQLGGNVRFGARTTTYLTSELFGNTMGVFQSRDGLLKNMSEEGKNRIKMQLKPLDILMEKTPFRLTDQFIPGYYGHVAIWVGTEQELKDIGVWDHPAVAPYQEAVRNGHHIIEALRPGVQINTLDHFLDIDDLVAIRDNNLTDEQKKDFLISAFMQIGKEYDFNFDVETDKEIVCSEIAYVVFKNIDWPTDRSMGRATISPDHVAWKAEPGGEFSLVFLYKNGSEIDKDKMQQVFLNNLNGPEGIKTKTTKKKQSPEEIIYNSEYYVGELN